MSMGFDFDAVIDRRNTDSLKWGRYRGRDVIPMWVADMDFQATYLAWIDATGLGVQNPARFFEDFGVGLCDGADFHGPGYLRLNFGCPRTILLEGLGRLRDAVAAR
jgi:bifunctional pyridoxal-dependent enzyme with beta-cystathionase and maltose regulon repressor activities